MGLILAVSIVIKYVSKLFLLQLKFVAVLSFRFFWSYLVQFWTALLMIYPECIIWKKTCCTFNGSMLYLHRVFVTIYVLQRKLLIRFTKICTNAFIFSWNNLFKIFFNCYSSLNNLWCTLLFWLLFSFANKYNPSSCYTCDRIT